MFWCMLGILSRAASYVGRMIGVHMPERSVDLTPGPSYRTASASARNDGYREALIGEALSFYANGKPILEYLGRTGEYRIRDVASGITASVSEDKISTRYLEQLVEDAAAWEQAERDAEKHE
jgi:hypothetical protein